MKIRESGMPREIIWEGFFNPVKILKTLCLNKDVCDVAEFGCGFGTFTIPAAELIRGKIYAIDIEPEMIKIVMKKAIEKKLDNIITSQRDFATQGTDLDSESVDYVMLFNILHGEAEKILRESWRILKPNGKIGIIHWNYDPNTPRGPPMEIRIKPEQCINLAESHGFVYQSTYDLKPYHFGIILRKQHN